MMRIGIDVRMIQDFPTGIGNYRENLIKALAKLPSEQQFVLVGNPGNKMLGWAKRRPRFGLAVIRSKPNSLHQHFLLPFELPRLGLDLFWTTPWGASVFLEQRYALTIYDLLYRRYPELASFKARVYEALVSGWIARRAELIFTISDFVKNDIVNFLKVDEKRVFNIQGAAGGAYFFAIKPPTPVGGCRARIFRRSRKARGGKGGSRRLLSAEPHYLRSKSQRVKSLAFKKYGVSKPYFVYVGNFRPHKNLQTLLRAFANLKYQMLNLKLVLVGSVDAKGRDRDSEKLLNLLEKLNLQENVVLTGRIDSDREVAAILGAAVALVHPSFHEGFGLTVLEAMSCGTPVIAANTTSIPEVVGDAGILVDPHDADGIARAMGKVFHYYQHDRKEYERLVQRGRKQARKFSWEKTARKVLEIFAQYDEDRN